MFNLSITQRYIPAVLLVAFFIIVANLLTKNVISSNEEYGKIINISGKQRMLSQRLVILGINYTADRNKSTKSELKDAIDEISSSHQYLLTKVFTKELSDIYYKQGLNDEFDKYVLNFTNLLLTNNQEYLKQSRDSSKSILMKLDKAVKEYEKYANSQLEILAQYEFYLMLTTLFVLLLEVFFIFKPAAKKIEANTQEIINKEEYEKAVIESNNNAIIAINETGKITTYNKKAEQMFGWTKEEMINTHNLSYIVPHEYKDKHNISSIKYLKTGESCGILGKEHELQAIKKDGTIFPIVISFGSSYKQNGVLVVANISDITLHKENESKLKALNENLETIIDEKTKKLQEINENLEYLIETKTNENIKQLEIIQEQSKLASMGEMIGAIAHQWRQPLNEINMSIQNLDDDYSDGLIDKEFIDKFIGKNKNTIKFMSNTIDDFRNFFRIDKVKDRFSTKEAINSTISIQSTQLNSHNINITLSGKDFEIDGFRSEFQQVILNIINNAKDAIISKNIKDGKIDIVLRDRYVEISDNGGGISKDVINRIFEPYFTTKDQGKGTGIGLYMSKMIIEDNIGGTVNVQNYNSGAKFILGFNNG
ncbi:multi-sensor signal transduction histidine kinase [Sulfurimonas gotlandica GD1]|uniref:histidine kinase n=1 Tax=Sulfurimonas gotlandica (strain DSM 19862 / JCM 16533 / GD1) TaxID=929558 RepID=B6BN45_SULGG|nr:ATP-binding protein [Sulfurimonas gotlandica]EDZ61607.1 PAS/PAC sensor signal transduction histidine kinase [Sulfurimonas gotlandica GD1]EHP30678.1 multi-sensor signal transduction histidine kinase [Sulfurimonas gotlandica GD1]